MIFLWLAVTLAALATALINPVIDGQPMQMPALGIAAIAALAWLYCLRRRLRGPRTAGKTILIDGSNVMHWNGGNPNITIVRDVVQALAANGHEVGVIFDANVGYKLSGRYMNDATLARHLNLPTRHVLVSPKGQPADVFLLQVARDRNAPIVSNDRFRDWQDDFPEIAEYGRLIHGGYRDGAPYLRPGKGKPA
ncbi:Zc3h12a-like Ribonuclease NYN domain-containing protein [Lutimaribacter pacificus]|uniref:Zc3h12a-like Ribonuclease NYN domain-containing protein n=1 Tax=Lutimaribacter pacificus TaxID=391948 RepID=A0A1H0I918_9RHOB|nr:hypothetical protein [Lutimaribacter pacificus]SDO27888.1 Zc3h12a-like Ribonuclease NYN domain-containing protein [Lutimaribacter pacificus]SHK24614.1 Zc3h12a-like Ribonuclease NYN domain-containing protein [Lutimaribacter pacificus]